MRCDMLWLKHRQHSTSYARCQDKRSVLPGSEQCSAAWEHIHTVCAVLCVQGEAGARASKSRTACKCFGVGFLCLPACMFYRSACKAVQTCAQTRMRTLASMC